MLLADRIRRGRHAVALARARRMDTAEWEARLKELLEEAGKEPADDAGFEPWARWEWRRVSIPQWRRILRQSVENGDTYRETRARGMLRDVLLDPDFVGDEL